MTKRVFPLIAGFMSAIAAPAFAQNPPAPSQLTTDAYGVDLVNGSFNQAVVEAAIGPEGSGGLAHVRQWVGTNNLPWRSAEVGGISIDAVGMDTIATVSGGLISETFKWNGTDWEPTRPTGSTLVQQTFSEWLVTDSRGNQVLLDANYGTVYELFANGDRRDFHWDTTGYPILRSITNNRGYQLHYDYGSGPSAYTIQSVTALNNAVDYCAPLATTCTYTRTWPGVSYTYYIGRIATATDQANRTTTYSYGVNNLGLLTITPPGATVPAVDITYTDNTELKVATANGARGLWTYSYGTSGGNTTITATSPDSDATKVTTNPDGLPISVTDPLNEVTSFAYDADGRLTRTTLPEGNYTQLTYDSRGNVTTVTQVPKSGSGLSNIVTSSTYPSTCVNPVTCNLPTKTTDARGNVTDYVWDSTHGGPVSITLPSPGGVAARPEARFGYTALYAYYKNSGGTIVAAATPVTLPTRVETCITGSSCNGTANEQETVIAYGATGVANNLLPTSNSKGAGDGSLTATTATTYDANSDVVTVDGPLSGSTDTIAYRYDTARRLVGVIGPDPDAGGARLNRARRITYDPRGAVTLAEAGTTAGYSDPNWAAFTPLQRQWVDYDDYGRPVETRQQSAGGTTYAVAQTTYDAVGRTDCVAVRMNPAAFASLPSSACTAGTAGSHGPDRISQMTYDARSQVVSATSGLGTADAVTAAATYTDNGLVASLTDGNGNVSIPVYDGFDRVSRLRYPNATGGGTSTTDYEEYAYDAASNVVSYRDRANRTFTTNYDNLNRSVQYTPPSGSAQIMGYDNLAQMTSLSDCSVCSWLMSWTYDALGRQTTQSDSVGNSVLTSQYDLAGRRTRLTWPDSVYVTYDYDLYGATTAIKEAGSTTLSAYAYDDLGRLTGVTRGNGAATSYAYDAVSRLSTLTQNPTGSTNDVAFTLGYNPAGQIVSRSVSNSAYVFAPTTGTTGYVNNGLNRVTNAGGTPVTYDANGNVTGGLTTSLGYDAENNLASAAGTATYVHDPLKRMYSQTLNGVTSRFAYDGMKPATEYSGSSGSTIAARYVPGLWMDDIAARYVGSGTGTPSWPLTDERGSIIAHTDNTGAVTATNAYDEYGVPDSGNTGPFQYTGQRWLKHAGLYDYKMRAYAPGAGRFVQADPLGYAAGLNLYGYVGSEPIGRIDPSGLEWVETKCSRSGSIGIPDADGTNTVWGEVIFSYACMMFVPDSADWWVDMLEQEVHPDPQVCAAFQTTIDANIDAIPSYVRNTSRWNSIDEMRYISARGRAARDFAGSISVDVPPEASAPFGAAVGVGGATLPQTASRAARFAGRFAPVLAVASEWNAVWASEAEFGERRYLAAEARIGQLRAGCA